MVAFIKTRSVDHILSKFPRQAVWKSFAALKVCAFLSGAVWGGLNTSDGF